MGILNNSSSSIIRIEPNPLKKSSIKIKINNISVSGGQPTYITGDNNKKIWKEKLKEAKNMSRMPGTIVEYTAAITSNGLNTGLEEMVTNPYSSLDFYRDGWERLLKGKSQIRLQELLEYKHGKKPGYYTNQLFNKVLSTYEVDDDTPFYVKMESRVSLRDGVTYLDLNKPLDEVNYYMLRAHKMVANSYEELAYNPDATHYIVDLQEKQRLGSKEARKMNKFAARLEELFETGDDTILKMCKALDISAKGIKDDKQAAYDEIDSIVKSDGTKYDEFMNMYKMWKDPAKRDIFLGYAELFDFVRTPGIISMKGNELFWYQPTDSGRKELWTWKSKADFVENFLNAPQYQEEVDALRSMYRAKTRYEL